MNDLCQLHTEGMMAGELKHRPLALIDRDVFIIFIATGKDKEMVDGVPVVPSASEGSWSKYIGHHITGGSRAAKRAL
jgi:hypothetical protein